MKYVLTNAQMREADRYTMEKLQMPASVLMGGAGTALADEVERMAATGDILCVCGGGNNGGDGFVCARVLQSRGRKVEVVCFAQKKSEECTANERKWIALGGEVFSKVPQKKYAVVVDCLFGTGFHGEAQGEAQRAILAINALKEAGAKVLAADIPSGLDGENGLISGCAVQADVTLCIGERKAGVYLGDGLAYAGEVKRADIGIRLPRENYARLIDREYVRELLPKRRRNTHKGSYGRAAIVAGSEDYVGAAFLAAAACLRSGAGYTTLYAPKNLLSAYALKAPELIIRASSEGGKYAFNEQIMRELLSYSAIAYGMGMGVSEEVCKGAVWLVEHYGGKLILDADGLNSLSAFADLPALWKNKKCDVLLTPHVREFFRLSGSSVEEILQGGTLVAQRYAKTHGVSVLLKNALSIVTDGERVALNAAGNSALAKGGSGDVLAGLCAGLCAQGADGYCAGVCGSYLLGKGGEFASKTFGEYAALPTDVVANLGNAFLTVTEDTDEQGGKE